MAVLANLVVQLSANTAALEKGLKNAKQHISGFGSAMSTVAKIAGGFILAQGIMKAPGFFMDAAKAAAEDAASVAKLQQAVENTGASWGKYEGALTGVVENAQKLAFSDDQARNSLSLLTAQTGSAEAAVNRFAIAQDLARGANIDLETASRLLGKVTEENVNVLARYGVAAKEGMTQTELFGMIQAKFGGQAETFAKSTAGQMEAAKIQMGELKETIGYAVLPIMTSLVSLVAEKLIPALQGLAAEWLPRIREAFDKIKEAVQPAIDKMIPFFESLSKNKDTMTVSAAIIGGVLVGAFIALAAAAWTAAAGVIAATWPFIAIGVAITGLIAIVVLAVKHWDDITDAIKRARDWFNDLPMPIKAVAVVLNLPLVALIALGVGINKLVTNWGSAWLTIRKFTEAAVNAAISAFNVLLHGIEQVINKIIDAWNMVPGHKDVAHIHIQIDEIDLTPIADAIGALQRLRMIAEETWTSLGTGAMSMVKGAIGWVGNLTKEAKALGASLGSDLGGGAGGAAEAFRGLDADLAALRGQMIATAEQGLVVLNNAIINETAELGALEQELTAVNQFHDAAAIHVADLESAISDCTTTMKGWEDMALEGSKAFSDASFALSQQQDALQLKINSVKEALYDEADKMDKTGVASIGLSGEVRRLAKSIGMDMRDSIFAGQMSLEDINEVIDRAGDKMTNLGLKASDVNLRENLQLEPLRRQLEELFNPTVEASFDAIVAGFTTSRDALKGLTDQQVIWNGALVDADKLIDFLTTRITDQTAIVDALKAAYSDLEGKLTAIDPAIKAIWEARGEPMIKSIEDAFAAIDRGDKAAADAAMVSALALWDQIKALVPGAETGIFAPLEKVLRDAETSIDVDISGMTKTLSGDLGGVGTKMEGVKEAVAGGFVAMMANLRDWVVTLLSHIAGQVNFLSLLVDIRDDIRGLPSAIAAVMPAAATALQGGGYITHPGLAYVHAREAVVPARGSSGGGDTNIYMTVQGSILSERDLKRIVAEGLRRGEFRGTGA